MMRTRSRCLTVAIPCARPTCAPLSSRVNPLAFLLAARLVRADTVPPYLAFPEPGLDDPAMCEGHARPVY